MLSLLVSEETPFPFHSSSPQGEVRGHAAPPHNPQGVPQWQNGSAAAAPHRADSPVFTIGSYSILIAQDRNLVKCLLRYPIIMKEAIQLLWDLDFHLPVKEDDKTSNDWDLTNTSITNSNSSDDEDSLTRHDSGLSNNVNVSGRK
eukprot:scaffold1708_cov156-Ochromonas_danica.AAC.4